jgi:predicted O-methyltransferase YrrM
MAASLATSAVLWSLCEAIRPRQIIDAGSGFSTYVFATWACGETCSVLAIDDNPGWQERTQDFLTSYGVEVPKIADPSAFKALPRAQLIFFDYSLPPERIGYLRALCDSLTAGGYMVIDDMHQSPFGRQIRAARLPYGFRLYSLRRWTLDEFGRFSSLVIPRHGRANRNGQPPEA